MHWINPDSLKESRHRVRLFLLNAHGDVDGFISTKGLQVHVPPHMGEALTSAVTIGQRIGIRGLSPKGADVLIAVALDPKHGGRIECVGPTPNLPKKNMKSTKTKIEGVTERTLYAPRGERTGLLLTSGVSVRFDSEMADNLAEFLVEGTHLGVEGNLLSNEWGTAMDAEYLWMTG